MSTEVVKNGLDQLFVGRQTELAEFCRILDDNHPREGIVLFFSGLGGIGKTWLIKKCLQLTQEATYSSRVLAVKSPVDWITTRTHHPEGFLDELRAALCDAQPGLLSCGFENYDYADSALERARLEKDETSHGVPARLEELAQAFHQDLVKIAASQKVVIGLDTFEIVQDTPLGKWILSKEGLVIPGIILLVGSRNPNPFETEKATLPGLSDEAAVDLYFAYHPAMSKQEPPNEFVLAYIHRLNCLSEGNPLLLSLALFLRQREWEEEELQKLEAIADKKERLKRFKALVIRGLSPAEADGEVWIGNFHLLDVHFELLVYMAYLHPRFNTFFLEKLVRGGYLKPVDGQWDYAEPVETLWRDFQPQSLFFVKERPEAEIQLHDILKDILLEHALREVFVGEELWKKFADEVVGWYDELIARENARVPADKALIDYLRVEKLIYALQLKVPKAHPTFRQVDLAGVVETLNQYSRERSDILQRLVADDFSPDLFKEMEEEYREQAGSFYDLYRLMGIITRRAYRWSLSRKYFQHSLESAKTLGDLTKVVQAHLELHNSTWQEDCQESLRLLEEALEISRRNHLIGFIPSIYYEIGFTYRKMDRLRDAIKWYGQALEVCKDRWLYATILNDMGYAKALLGRYKQAMADIESAQHLREDMRADLIEQISKEECLLQSNTLTPMERVNTEAQIDRLKEQLHGITLRVGWSYNTLGESERFRGRLSEAAGSYTEALVIFQGEENFSWLARASYSRGEAYRRIAVDLQHKNRLSSVREYDELAYRDIHQGIEWCEQYGLVDQRATAHRRMGRLLHDRSLRIQDPIEKMNCWGEALNEFRTALEAACQNKNVLEELECLAEIAFLGDDLVDFQVQLHRPAPEIDQAVEQAKGFIEELRNGIKDHEADHDQIFQYPVFTSLLWMEEAALAFSIALIKYNSGQIQEAEVGFAESLEKYTRAFVNLAGDPGYGSARYLAHRNHLFRNIARLPNIHQRETWLKTLINAWEEHDLLVPHPGFHARCSNDLRSLRM